MDKNKNKLIELWDKVALNFGSIGPRYWDRFGHRLVELSHIEEGNYVLDIGMGRGASLFPARERVGHDGQVIGIDISGIMVRTTKEKIIKENIKNIEIIEMDTEKLNFPKEYFHNIVSGFSIGNVAHNRMALKNILKVLKKQGEIAFSFWGIQKDQKWLDDITNEFLSSNNSKAVEYDATSESIILNTVEGVSRFLENLGLKDITAYGEENRVIYLNANQWWNEMWNNAARGIFENIQKLGNDKFEEYQEKVNQGLKAYESDEGICFNMNVIYAYGIKE